MQLMSRWWQGVVQPGWVRPGPTSAQRRTDVILVGGFLVAATASALLINSIAAAYTTETQAWWQQAIWIVGLAVPMVWRRSYPTVAVIAVSVVFITSQLLGFLDNLIASIALFWALYSVGAWSRFRLRAFWVRCGVVAAMFGLLLVNLLRYQEEAAAAPAVPSALIDPGVANVLYSLLINMFYFAASTAFGTAAWTSAKRRFELGEQAKALALAQQVTAQRAVMSERVRIARELHDVVAHHVSVMGVQASAARRVLGKSPDLASDALTSVETTARMAITELRGLLGVLRDAAGTVGTVGTDGTVGTVGTVGTDGTVGTANRPSPAAAAETYHAAPGLDQLPELIQQAQSAGPPISFGVFGTPRAVSAGISLSVFRIVQEALTNVIKHSAASRVDVRLRFGEASVEVEITDDGAASASRPATRPSDGAGLGLIGMRERVAVHEGELDAGPRPSGGFRVRARIPLPTAEQASPSDMEVGVSG